MPHFLVMIYMQCHRPQVDKWWVAVLMSETIAEGLADQTLVMGVYRI